MDIPGTMPYKPPVEIVTDLAKVVTGADHWRHRMRPLDVMLEQHQATDFFRSFSTLMGTFVLCVAFVILIMILVTTYQIIYSPEDVPAAEYFYNFLFSELPLLEIDIDSRETTVGIDPAARFMVIVLVGGVVLIAMSSVFGALVSGGLGLLRFGRDTRTTNDT